MQALPQQRCEIDDFDAEAEGPPALNRGCGSAAAVAGPTVPHDQRHQFGFELLGAHARQSMKHQVRELVEDAAAAPALS